MPLKRRGRATGFERIDGWDGGVGWLAHPDEEMRRASHALVDDGVWLVDPLDAPGLDGMLSEFGEVAGVVVLLDRHARDAETLARRHDVPVYLPRSVNRRLDAPVERFDGTLADTGYRRVQVIRLPGWTETALFDGETLVVADALGTADYFRAPDERLGVHPILRLLPPRSLGALSPERILVGHGTGVFDDASTALDDALSGARRSLPRVWLRGLRAMLP